MSPPLQNDRKGEIGMKKIVVSVILALLTLGVAGGTHGKGGAGVGHVTVAGNSGTHPLVSAEGETGVKG
jgi:hypothetical protein